MTALLRGDHLKRVLLGYNPSPAVLVLRCFHRKCSDAPALEYGGKPAHQCTARAASTLCPVRVSCAGPGLNDVLVLI